ncbi:MAG TPA: hypothetical protein VMW50_03530 [Dehalococcoidia bacterium]|nr:hypothetical protein [Dehalococcoidia bacterium]
MSELSKAIQESGINRLSLDTDTMKIMKDAFKGGWEAREALLNRRVSEIEKAAVKRYKEKNNAT